MTPKPWLHLSFSQPPAMSFKDSPKPPTALQKTKAVSLELTEETASLVSDSVSINSTITLENLPLNPSRLLTPPWSTEDTPSTSLAGPSQTSGWSSSDTEERLSLDWARVLPATSDTTRSAETSLDWLLFQLSGAAKLYPSHQLAKSDKRNKNVFFSNEKVERCNPTLFPLQQIVLIKF